MTSNHAARVLVPRVQGVSRALSEHDEWRRQVRRLQIGDASDALRRIEGTYAIGVLDKAMARHPAHRAPSFPVLRVGRGSEDRSTVQPASDRRRSRHTDRRRRRRMVDVQSAEPVRPASQREDERRVTRSTAALMTFSEGKGASQAAFHFARTALRQ